MKRLQIKPLVFVIILFSLSSSSTSRDTLTPTQPLSDGEILVSSGGIFALGFFNPAKSTTTTTTTNRYVGIWYKKIQGNTIIWVANRCRPVHGTTGILSITSIGSLAIADRNSTIIWSFASTTQVVNPIAQLLDTGNLVVTSLNDRNNIVWQSFDYPTDTLIPGMKLGWNLNSGLNRNLTGWSSPTDPSPGNYTFAVDLRGAPQVIFEFGSVRLWRFPWNGGALHDDPDSKVTFSFIFVNNKEEITYTVKVAKKSTTTNKSILTRLVVNSTGIAERFVSLNSGQWSQYWYLPSWTQCDSFGLCGPNSMCTQRTSSACSCMPGFEPRLPGLWGLDDYSGGCIRKTTLDCRNGTDGFIILQRTLLPDMVQATVNMGMRLNECRSACLRNCSCTGVASADMNGNGCISWFTDLMDVQMYPNAGQEFYLRLAAADISLLSIQSHKRRNVTLAVVLSLVLGILLLITTTAYYIWRKQKLKGGGNNSMNDENIMRNPKEDGVEPLLYDLNVLETATNNFSDENKLGEGGSGPVYMGKMRGGQLIAVKRLPKASVLGLHELKAEVVLAATLQHRNLVRLLGYCEGNERLLVYEYMPNKSLDAFLFDEEKVKLLCWETRYQIILGIARGLLYLHQDSRLRIIHRDLKASNILLDKDMNPKISDFGLARAFGGDETKMMTGRIAGTFGYMAPEYALNGVFSVKSDVFSFGVLVLEIISGKQSKGVYFSETEEYLLEEAWKLWMEDNISQLVDSSLGSSLSMGEVLRCIKIGLLCVQDNPEDRPTMSSVAVIFGYDHELLPEPKYPGLLLRKDFP